MANTWARIVVLGVTLSACFGQNNSQQQDPTSPPGAASTKPTLAATLDSAAP
jgi:hypothetical protein